jgi:lysophospholipase L1-like esterase
MPSAEIHGRIRRIAGQVSSDAVARFARTTRESGARPLVLALNAVVDAESLELPDQEALRAANLPVINLLRIYPEDRRAALRVAPWDEHPNVEGHQLIADRLYPELTAYLSREFGST